MTHIAGSGLVCNRRQVLRWVGAAGLAAAAPACRRGNRREMRVGFLANLTHAVPMVMEERGSLAAAVGRPAVLVPFSAGPSVIEALFAGDLDTAYCGPGPAINAFVRSKGRVRILAAACYGGAALVVRRSLAVDSPRDLLRARIASPQIGNTQDIALRQWLADHDLVTKDRGGTVQVVPTAPSNILTLFRAKEIDAAWVVEPWVSRLVNEGGGRVFLEESVIHDSGVYPTTLLVVSTTMLRTRPKEVAALVRVNAATVAWVNRNGAAARSLVNEALERHTGAALPPSLLESAWARLSFGTDPVLKALRESAIAARRLGYLPHSDISGIVVEPSEWLRKGRR